MTHSDPRARGALARRAGSLLAAGMVVTLLAPAAGSAQQPLAERIAQVRGDAELRFASRPGVCGDGEGSVSFISPGEMDSMETHGHGGWNFHCEPGPVRVRLHVADGAVTSVRTYVGERHATAPATAVTDLGVVGAREAADYFLGLTRSASEEVARKAIVPAALADSVTVWPRLIELARDRDRPVDVRKPALFWAGQVGETKVLEPVRAIANDASEDESLRKHAIFVLSQCDDSAATDALIDIARNDPDHSMRKQAFFWLGQRDDPRVIELLTSILEK